MRAKLDADELHKDLRRRADEELDRLLLAPVAFPVNLDRAEIDLVERQDVDTSFRALVDALCTQLALLVFVADRKSVV